MDGPRDCHTEWSKSEREKWILSINAYIWNLEKWYRWTYLQGRNRDTEVENGYVDTGREAECGTNWEIRILTPPAVKYIVRTGCTAWASQVALVVKNPPANAGDLRRGLRRSPGGGHDNTLQYSCLENPMGRRAWWTTVHGVAKSWIWPKRLSTQHSGNLLCI